MSPEELDALERLAKEATPGPWEHRPHDEQNNYTVFAYGRPVLVSSLRVLDRDAIANAAFVAGASPDVVLSLVEEVRNLRAERVPEHETLLRAERERDAYKRAVERMAHMAATLRTEAVGVSPGVQSIASKIAREIESRLEIA